MRRVVVSLIACFPLACGDSSTAPLDARSEAESDAFSQAFQKHVPGCDIEDKADVGEPSEAGFALARAELESLLSVRSPVLGEVPLVPGDQRQGTKPESIDLGISWDGSITALRTRDNGDGNDYGRRCGPILVLPIELSLRSDTLDSLTATGFLFAWDGDELSGRLTLPSEETDKLVLLSLSSEVFVGNASELMQTVQGDAVKESSELIVRWEVERTDDPKTVDCSRQSTTDCEGVAGCLLSMARKLVPATDGWCVTDESVEACRALGDDCSDGDAETISCDADGNPWVSPQTCPPASNQACPEELKRQVIATPNCGG